MTSPPLQAWHTSCWSSRLSLQGRDRGLWHISCATILCGPDRGRPQAFFCRDQGHSFCLGKLHLFCGVSNSLLTADSPFLFPCQRQRLFASKVKSSSPKSFGKSLPQQTYLYGVLHLYSSSNKLTQLYFGLGS